MHGRLISLRRALILLAGAAEALLLARLLARLLAARPDNPSVAALYGLTWPLIAPLAFLDLGQRRFGAVLEISTLATATLMPCLVWLLLWAWDVATCGRRGSS